MHSGHPYPIRIVVDSGYRSHAAMLHGQGTARFWHRRRAQKTFKHETWSGF